MNAAIITAALALVSARGPYEVEVRGEIRTVKVGPTTRAALITEDETYVLAARRPGLDEELHNLEGATIQVHGYRDASLRPPGVDVLVEDYEIVDVGDGRVPRIGQLATLTRGEEILLLFVDAAGRADVLPESWKKRMTEHVGAKMWILGRRGDDGAFTPTRFRILRSGASQATPPKGSR